MRRDVPFFALSHINAIMAPIPRVAIYAPVQVTVSMDVHGKKYRATFANRKVVVRFGWPGSTDFLRNKNTRTRDNYIARHALNGENWTASGMYTPGFWSQWFSWSEPTVEGVQKLMLKKFGIRLTVDPSVHRSLGRAR